MSDWTNVPETEDEKLKKPSKEIEVFMGQDQLDNMLLSEDKRIALYARAHSSTAKDGLHAFISSELERRTDLDMLVDGLIDLTLSEIIHLLYASTNMDEQITRVMARKFRFRADRMAMLMKESTAAMPSKK